MKMAVFSKIGVALAAGLLALSPVAAASATLSFSLNDAQGSAPSTTDVTLEDVAGGVKFTYLVNDPVNTADLIEVYFDVLDPYLHLALTFSGAGVITDTEFDTKSVAAGNIGQTFDVGVQIGAEGSGSDFFDSFAFTVLGIDLDVTDFFGQTFAVRGQTVGVPGCTGCSSSKNFGTAPTSVAAVPLPAAGLLLAGALGAFGLMRRRRIA